VSREGDGLRAPKTQYIAAHVTEHDTDALIGRTFGGRYLVDRVLGGGGMGAVFAAKDEESGAEVALKVLLPQLAKEETHLARFRREAEVMGLLDHPHVVEDLATGVEDDGTPWIAMELAKGETLSSLMRREQTLSVERAVGIVRQIVAALIAAHEVGIIHRDVKPGNVMVRDEDGRERVKVLDFGLARFIESPTYQKLTVTGYVVGTPSYMAPEQAFGDRVDEGADIYAIGAILHALLTGTPPFGRGKIQDVLPRLMANERDRLTETRRDLGDIVEVVERCLEPESEQRYVSAADLDAALAPFDRGEPSVEEWVRPKTIHTLVLAPDPVLDAPRPRKRPRTVALAPHAATAKPRQQERASRRWMFLAFAFLATALISATAVYLARPETTASSIVIAPDPGAPPPATPVAVEIDEVDAGVDAPTLATDAAASEREDHQPAIRHRRASPADTGAPPGPPPPEDFIRIDVLESYLPPSRLRSGLTLRFSQLGPCLRNAGVLGADQSYDWTIQMAGRTGYSEPLEFAESNRLVRICIDRATSGLWLPDLPGAWRLRIRVRLDPAPEGEGALIVNDQTDWASRRLTPPRLRVTFTVTRSDIDTRVLRSRLVSGTRQLSECLEEHGGLPVPPPYTGEVAWHRINIHLSRSFSMRPETPGSVTQCIDRLVRAIELPYENGESTQAQVRAVAARRTSIQVTGP